MQENLSPNGRRRRSIPAACPFRPFCPFCPFAAPAKDGRDGKDRRDTNLLRGASVSPRKAGAPFSANAKGRSTISFRRSHSPARQPTQSLLHRSMRSLHPRNLRLLRTHCLRVRIALARAICIMVGVAVRSACALGTGTETRGDSRAGGTRKTANSDTAPCNFTGKTARARSSRSAESATSAISSAENSRRSGRTDIDIAGTALCAGGSRDRTWSADLGTDGETLRAFADEQRIGSANIFGDSATPDPIGSETQLDRPDVGEAKRKSAGCIECHKTTDAHTMHASPNVVLGCTDCHGGNAKRGLNDSCRRTCSPRTASSGRLRRTRRTRPSC